MSTDTASQPALTRNRPSVEFVEPLAVRLKVAWHMLGCRKDKGYQLIADGEIDSFTCGAARMVTTESIRRYIARQLAKPDKKIRKSPNKRASS
jgi:hypothetical protein